MKRSDNITDTVNLVINSVLIYASIIVGAVSLVCMIVYLIKKLTNKPVYGKKVKICTACLAVSVLLLAVPSIFSYKSMGLKKSDAEKLAAIQIDKLKNVMSSESDENSDSLNIVVDDVEFNITLEHCSTYDREYYEKKLHKKDVSFWEWLFSKCYDIDGTLVYAEPSSNSGSLYDLFFLSSFVNSVVICKDGFVVTVDFAETFVSSKLIRNFVDTVCI